MTDQPVGAAAVPFPFVVGVGRSGTTLLRSMLDAHPDLAMVHESRFVAWMAQHRGRYEGAGGFDNRRFVSDLHGTGAHVPSRFSSWDLDAAEVLDRFEAAPPDDLADAIRRLYGLFARARGKSRYGDKTPAYILQLPALGDLLPEARFVHLVRDGRDVALSMLDADFGGVNIPHAAWLWSRRLLQAHAAGTQLGSNRYRVWRYEDLIDGPETVLGEICAFLALDFDATMLRYFEQPEQVFRGLGGQEHHEHLNLPVTKGLRDWRAEMPTSDVAVFEHVAGEALEVMGYRREAPAGGRVALGVLTATRIAKGRAVAAWRARRRRRSRRPRAAPTPRA